MQNYKNKQNILSACQNSAYRYLKKYFFKSQLNDVNKNGHILSLARYVRVDYVLRNKTNLSNQHFCNPEREKG